MITKSLFSLLCLGTIATLASTTVTQPVRAASAPTPETDSPPSTEAGIILAQSFPYASPDQQVVMVQGTGKVSAAAETAEIEFVFVNYDPYYDPYACYSEPEASTSEDTTAETDSTTTDSAEISLPPTDCPLPEATPITRSELQPAIDALTQAGIADSDLEIRLPDNLEDYLSSYYPGSASISFDLNQPTQQSVQDLVTAVEESLIDVENLYLQDRYVQYTLGESGCNNLERQAYQAAIADARGRATVLASALEVELGGVPSVADSVNPTPDPYASYPSYCDAEQTSSAYPYGIPSYYDSSVPAEVEVRRTVFVTYPVLQR